MAEPAQETASLRFRLYDGTDIGPLTYPLSTSVGAVKEALLREWPQARALDEAVGCARLTRLTSHRLGGLCPGARAARGAWRAESDSRRATVRQRADARRRAHAHGRAGDDAPGGCTSQGSPRRCRTHCALPAP